MTELKTRIKHKNGTPDEWSQATNFSPLKGELIVYNDTTNPRMKIGDGETNVNDLPFINNAFVTVNLDGAGDGEDFIPDDNLVINAETLGGKPASSYMLKTDTATNSNNFGNQPPDYYAKQSDLTSLIGSDSQTAKNADNLGGVSAADYALKTDTVANANKLGGTPAAEYALKTDTVANADKLGGKEPEYYLPAVNLLDNSDFAIAQAGYNAMHGNEYFCADRWNRTNNEISLSRNAGYITLTSTADYRQIYQKVLVSDLVADAYTFAVKKRSASVSSSLYLYGENANGNATNIKSVSMGTGGEWQTFVLNFTRADVAQYTKIWCCIRNQAIGAVDYNEPVLYPGTYTADTLPPYVPTHPRVENLKIGNAVQPRNLLDNPDFAVAQAGYGGTHGADLYAADRWKAHADTVCEKTSNGIVLSQKADSTASKSYILQYFNLDTEKYDGKTLAFAAKIDGAVYIANLTVINGQQVTVRETAGTSTLVFRVTESGEKSYCQIDVYPEAITVEWAALYEGTYTADTLPPFVPRPYAVELAECRRYYRTETGVVVQAYSNGYAVGVNYEPMRITPPTVTVTLTQNVYGTKTIDGETTVNTLSTVPLITSFANPNFVSGEWYRIRYILSADL